MQKIGGTRESLRTLLAGKSSLHSVILVLQLTYYSLILSFTMAETIRSISVNKETFWRPRMISFWGSLSFVRTYRITPTGAAMENKELPLNYLKDKMMVPNANPPGDKDVNLLSQFFERR